eukprot:TRINITY_DN255_c6_g1_i2.p1 TRINITY_DN255_c6_g1~~TRINITY_DN255_c6_g1_i2.p1  ORF type:complete len:146 (+),score=7.20 TRINITY_DN255_c6_g1_i2:3194-3631(+)
MFLRWDSMGWALQWMMIGKYPSFCFPSFHSWIRFGSADPIFYLMKRWIFTWVFVGLHETFIIQIHAISNPWPKSRPQPALSFHFLLCSSGSLLIEDLKRSFKKRDIENGYPSGNSQDLNFGYVIFSYEFFFFYLSGLSFNACMGC